MAPPLLTTDDTTLSPRNVPQINGSSAGFIALIVCLCLIILISSLAVFFLLRDHQQSPAERASRRRRRHITNGNEYQYTSNSPPEIAKRSTKLADWFAFTRSTRKKNGWVQANSGDDWDVTDWSSSSHSHSQHRGLPTSNERQDSYDTPFTPPKSTTTTEPYLQPNTSELYTGSALTLDRQHQPSALSTTQQPHPVPVSRTPSPLPPLSIHSHGGGADPDLDASPQFTTHSGEMKAFGGGTKFMESV